jgi:nitrite reductase/ring-hydroxylating ferredoxin subunit
MRSVRVDGIAIVIARLPDGSFRALRDVCPHLGVQLSRGSLGKVVDAHDMGGYCLTDRVAARCSWHGYEFDVETGRCIADDRWRVKVYPVRVVNGTVVVER